MSKFIMNTVDIMGEIFEVPFYADPFKAMVVGDTINVRLKRCPIEYELVSDNYGVTIKLINKQHINYSDRLKYTFDLVYIPVVFVCSAIKHTFVYDAVTNNSGYFDDANTDILNLVRPYGRGIDTFTKVHIFGNYVWLRTATSNKLAPAVTAATSNDALVEELLTMPKLIEGILKDAFVLRHTK
jgi:hypothetical protein